MTEHLYQFEVGDPWEGLVLSRLGWLMITHLSVEKTNRTKNVNISPWIFTCYIYIHYIVICMQLSLYIFAHIYPFQRFVIGDKSLCFFQSSKSMGFLSLFEVTTFWVLRIPGIWRDAR